MEEERLHLEEVEGFRHPELLLAEPSAVRSVAGHKAVLPEVEHKAVLPEAGQVVQKAERSVAAVLLPAVLCKPLLLP